MGLFKRTAACLVGMALLFSTAAAETTLHFTFAGDCTLGMDQSFGYSGSFNAAYDAYGPAYFLQNVQSIFAQDDLTVVNFEGTLTDSDERADKTWAFRGDPAYARSCPKAPWRR